MPDRHKSRHSFLNSPHLSSQEWQHQRCGDLVAGLLAGSRPARKLLISSFVDTVGRDDAMLLDELEEKIRRKRKELSKRSLA